jgi:hypothetical protein
MWTRLLLAGVAAALLCLGQEAELVTSDIDNFWRAYDASEPGNRTEAFQRLYFDQASPGLRDFIRLRIGTAAQLAATVDRLPKFYASIRESTRSIESQRKVIGLYLGRFRGLYPEARIPPVYFVIGRLSSGGTLSENGLLIGTEVFSLGPEVDASEVREQSPAFFRAMGTVAKLPNIVIHELTHSQLTLRAQPPIPTLLAVTLLEGAADLVANLVSGRTAVENRADYAEANREALLDRYAMDLIEAPNATGKWLYNYSTVKNEPADLGYWIGEEICRDYLARAPEKRAALNNIMTLVDLEGIVRQSSFSYLLAPR